MRIEKPEKNGQRHRGLSGFGEATGPAQSASLGALFRTIGRWFWLIAIVAGALVAAVMWFSRAQAPLYEASTTILVGQNSGLIQNPGDVTGLQEITRTMAQAVMSYPVAEGAVRKMGLEGEMKPQELVGTLESEQIPDTQFIRVTYRDTDPERAQRVANAIGESFSEQVAELQRETAANAARAAEAFEREGIFGGVPPVVTATVWEPAQLPEAPVSPNPRTDGLLALVMGLMLGLGLAFLLEARSPRDAWRDPSEVEQALGLPTIGVVPKQRRGG